MVLSDFSIVWRMLEVACNMGRIVRRLKSFMISECVDRCSNEGVKCSSCEREERLRKILPHMVAVAASGARGTGKCANPTPRQGFHPPSAAAAEIGGGEDLSDETAKCVSIAYLW